MRTLEIKNTYKKSLKLVLRQGWNISAIEAVILQLLNDDILDPKLCDHALLGEYKDFRECHICADLVIIYQRDGTTLSLFKIGRHQDLFKNY